MFVSDKQRRHGIARAGAVQALPASTRSQQAVRLARVLQYGGRTLAAQEFRQLAPERWILAEAPSPAATGCSARRRLRAITREVRPLLRPGACLISAAPEVARLSYPELRATVSAALAALPDAQR